VINAQECWKTDSSQGRKSFQVNKNSFVLSSSCCARPIWSGHAGASGRYDHVKEPAFSYAFMLTQLGVEPAGQQSAMARLPCCWRTSNPNSWPNANTPARWRRILRPCRRRSKKLVWHSRRGPQHARVLILRVVGWRCPRLCFFPSSRDMPSLPGMWRDLAFILLSSSAVLAVNCN
jgi:hypothetical protein